MQDVIHCPDCNESIEVEGPLEAGEVLECEGCGVKVEVTNTNPLEYKTVANSGTCPDCNQPLEIDQAVEVGEIIECESCGAELEVIQVSPLEVALIEEEK